METAKEAYQQMEEQIKGWGQRLALFKAKADTATGDTRIELRARASELKMRQSSAIQYLFELQNTDGSEWRPVVTAVKERWSLLSAAVETMWTAVE